MRCSWLVAAWLALVAGSAVGPACREGKSADGSGLGTVRMATTTSVENSGLLRAILPSFEERYGARVDVVAVGTGRALALGRRGDVDLLLVHDPARERRFLAEGYGLVRVELFWNEFLFVGPPGDPAGLRRTSSAVQALRAVAASGVPYVVRDDASGTAARAERLERDARVSFGEGQVIRAGVGMAAALRMASEKGAYLLTDEGTFLALRDKLRLEVVFRGDPGLRNVYSAILVHPRSRPEGNHVGAGALLGYLAGRVGQERIAAYRVGGELLFRPLILPAASRRFGKRGHGR